MPSLQEHSNRFANALIKHGVAKGDCVALFLPNIPQFIIAYFGVLKAGAVVTAISPLHREREVAYQLADSGAETLVALDSLNPVVAAAKEKTQLKTVILTGMEDYGTKNADSTAPPNTHSFIQLIKEASPTQPNIQIAPDTDLAALQYTGGTTGTPKGAMLTHRNLLSNALCFCRLDTRGNSKRNFPDCSAAFPHLRHDNQHDRAHQLSRKNGASATV